MSTLLIALPIPSQTTEEMIQGFAQEVKAKWGDFTKARTAVGSTLEAWAVQDLPDGGKLFIVCIGADDPVKANRLFAESKQAFDRWFKDKAGALLNANFDQPLPPITRTVFDWHA
jgi:hypothetical protein